MIESKEFETAINEWMAKFFEWHPQFADRMRSVIHNMRLKCGTKCPRCGAELWHFTLRGFPICSNYDCMKLVLPTQNLLSIEEYRQIREECAPRKRKGISKAQRRQIEREDAEGLLEELGDEE